MKKWVVVLSFALGVAVTTGVATAQDAGTAPPAAPVPASGAAQPRDFRFIKLQWGFAGLDEPYVRDLLQQASASGWTFESTIAGQNGVTAYLLLSRPKR